MASAPDDDTVRRTLLRLLDERAADATICPSEVARALAPNDEAVWRALMPQVREAAARLAADGAVRVLQKGRDVDALGARGPLRIGRPRPAR